jgi:hypothetical protein
LSPWSRRRRSGPPQWPGRRYAQAFALALCNHAHSCPCLAAQPCVRLPGEVKAKTLAPFRARPCRHSVPPRDAALPPTEIVPSRECERQLDPVLAHLLRRMSVPTQSSPSPPRVKLKHPVHDRLVALLHLTAENVSPPRRTNVRPSQCSCSSARAHTGEHPGVPPRSSPPWPSHRHACALK